MAIKDIFTVLDIYNESGPATRVALDLAERLEAHVTGLALAMEPLAPGFLASPIPAEFVVEAIEAAEKGARESADRFAAKAAAIGVAAEARTATVYSGGTPLVVREAQLSDLIIVGQEHPDQPEPMRTALIEALLFDAGAPLLVIPYHWTAAVNFKRVMIGWDGSSTSARAVHAALPVLAMAEHIDIVIVAGAKSWHGEPGADVATYLARHGLDVAVSTVAKEAGDIASTLASHAAEASADLMVLGAYGHNRFREFIIGGVTRDVLAGMSVPTLMSH